MKKLQFLPLMALVLGLGLTVSMSAFKSDSKLDPPADGWYLVTIINPALSHTDPTNQAIGGATLTPQDVNEEGCARTINTGDLCAVFLDFTVSATAVPAKVSDVNTTFESITDDAQMPE